MTTDNIVLMINAWLVMVVIASFIMVSIAFLATCKNIYFKKTLNIVGAITILAGLIMLTCVVMHVNNRPPL